MELVDHCVMCVSNTIGGVEIDADSPNAIKTHEHTGKSFAHMIVPSMTTMLDEYLDLGCPYAEVFTEQNHTKKSLVSRYIIIFTLSLDVEKSSTISDCKAPEWSRFSGAVER